MCRFSLTSVYFFLPSSLFDIVAPQVGPAMFHYLNGKVKQMSTKFRGKKLPRKQIKTEEG